MGSRIPSTVRKAKPVVHARVVGEPRRVGLDPAPRNAIGATEMKVFLTLLARAQAKRDDSTEFAIDWMDLVRSVGLEGNPSRVQKALDLLWSTPIAIDIEEGDAVRSIRCHYLSYDHTRRDETRGRLVYAFDRILWRYLDHPKVYSLIQLETANAIKDAFALRLYEILSGMLHKRDNGWNASVDEFRAAMDVEEGRYTRFDNLHNRKIRAAVAEINEKSEMLVEHRLVRGPHGKATGVRFALKHKTHPAYVQPRQGVGVRNRDAATVDLFSGKTDAEASRVVVRPETLTRAAADVPEGENVPELLQRWGEEMPNPGPDPDEAFLAWVRLRADAAADSAMETVDVDALMADLLDGGGRR